MAERLILRHENELPSDVSALLHGPPPDHVWHLASHPRIGNPFRVATVISLWILLSTMGLLLITAIGSISGGSSRSEGLIITGAMVLFAAGFHGLCLRAKMKAQRLEADLEAGRVRFGLWLTADHVLSRDYEGLSCARRRDIAKVDAHHGGLRLPDLLILRLNTRESIRIIVNSLDGWAGQTDKLRDAFEARLTASPGIDAKEMQQIADACRQRRDDFSGFVNWLNGEAERLKCGPVEKAVLLAMAATALASWPDAARLAQDEWCMHTEVNGTYEYGGSQSGSDTRYFGFKTTNAFWLLPLCRTAYFNEAESIFPNVASVEAGAITFQSVPLTCVEFTGGMAPDVFDAFLRWMATKPLRALRNRDYSTDRNSVSNLSASAKTKLASVKNTRGLA